MLVLKAKADVTCTYLSCTLQFVTNFDIEAYPSILRLLSHITDPLKKTAAVTENYENATDNLEANGMKHKSRI